MKENIWGPGWLLNVRHLTYAFQKNCKAFWNIKYFFCCLDKQFQNLFSVLFLHKPNCCIPQVIDNVGINKYLKYI